MTREQAEELVWDLIQAHSDLCHSIKSPYADDFESIRERVVSHLTTRETCKGFWDWS